MKYIEKALELYPSLLRDDLLEMCPYNLKIMDMHCETFADSCYDCWNREVPKKTLMKIKNIISVKGLGEG